MGLSLLLGTTPLFICVIFCAIDITILKKT